MTRDIEARLRNISACESGCEGRCAECPDKLMREAADTIAALKAQLAEAHVALFLAKAFITRDYDSLPNDINSEKAVIDHINAVLRKMEKPNG